jgi:CPA1 family monovalent cation:H+ antiporter
LFTLVLAMAASGHVPTAGEGFMLLLEEAGGGIVYGLVLGYVLFLMLRSIDSYDVEVLLTLAAVLGGYALADQLHVSGPLAMVVVGLVIGNHGRALAMSDKTREQLDMFWALLDEILNAVLFVLVGLEVTLIPLSADIGLAALAVIVVVLLARLVSVAGPIKLFPRAFALPRGSWQVLTWGGLRGGISVALALSLPNGPERDLVLALTYAVVVFAILVQGLTIGKVIRRTVAA